MIEQPAAYSMVQSERSRPVKQLFFIFVEQLGDESLELRILEAQGGLRDLAYALYSELLRVVERLNGAANLYQVVGGKFAVQLLFVVPELCVYFPVGVGEGEVEIGHALCRHLAVDRLYQAEALDAAVFIELSKIHIKASVCLS